MDKYIVQLEVSNNIIGEFSTEDLALAFRDGWNRARRSSDGLLLRAQVLKDGRIINECV